MDKKKKGSYLKEDVSTLLMRTTNVADVNNVSSRGGKSLSLLKCIRNRMLPIVDKNKPLLESLIKKALDNTERDTKELKKYLKNVDKAIEVID